MTALRAGERVRVGYGYATALPSFDFETASGAGFFWDGHKLLGPDGAAKGKKGLPVVGRRNYINHNTFRVLSLSWDLLDGDGPQVWTPASDLQRIDFDWAGAGVTGVPWPALFGNPPDHPYPLLCYIHRGGLMAGWNTGFEYDVWNEHCVPAFGWPVLKLEQLRCSMAKARAHAMPGALGDFGEVARLTIQKDKDGKRLLDKFSIPQKPTKKRPNFWIMPHDEPEEFTKLLAYNKTDVLSEAEAALRTPDLSPDELQNWLVDQRVNLRGIQCDTEAVDACITIVRQAYEKYNAELSQLTNGAVRQASELQALSRWLAGRGVYMDSLDDEAVTGKLKELKKGGHASTVEYRVLELRGLLGSASIKKLFAFKNQSANGRLFDLYTFFGARTGRWTGNGPQPQNLPSGIFHSLEEVEKALAVIRYGVLELVEYHYPNNSALEIISSCLRGLLIAAPGHELICSDYSAIEGVVTAALAGEEWRLHVFRTHGMIYEASAASIAGVPFDEFVKHRVDTGGVAEYVHGVLMGIQGGAHHPLRKKLGKFAELAGGFGGWIPAWKNFGADEYLNDDEIKRAILQWRAASPMIAELWGGQSRGRFRDAFPELYGLEGAAVAAVRWPGQAFDYRGINYQMSVQDDILYCRVPSGGFLTYHRPRLEPSTRPYANPWEVQMTYEGDNKNPKMGPIGWNRMSLYGGKQTENVVQKEARAIQANALVNLDRAGYRPVIHSHDEIAGEVPIGWGSIEEFEAIAAVKPEFAKDWPIRMKGGWRGPRYGKFD